MCTCSIKFINTTFSPFKRICVINDVQANPMKDSFSVFNVILEIFFAFQDKV